MFDLLTGNYLPRGWNAALEMNKDHHSQTGNFYTFYDMCRNEFHDRIRRKVPEMARFSSRIMRGMFKRMSIGLEGHRAGIWKMPRYKGRNRSIDSFDVPVEEGFQIRQSGFKLPRSKRKTRGPHWGVHIMGLGFCRFKGKPPKGEIKDLTVKRTARRINFVFSVEEEIEVRDPSTSPVVGIDPGTKDMLTLSNGLKIPGRERDLTRINALSRKMAGQRKGSNSRRKTVILLKKEWQRIRESERGFIHRTTTDIIRKFGPNIAIEKPNIGKMTRKGGEGNDRDNSRSIYEQCWGFTRNAFGYKAEEAGGMKIDVNPANTTRDCSECGHRKSRKVPKNVRIYRCESDGCSHVIDRDENAAINMGRRGLKSWPQESGRAIPGGVLLRCSVKQEKEGKPQNSASSRLHAALQGAYGEEGNDLRLCA